MATIRSAFSSLTTGQELSRRQWLTRCASVAAALTALSAEARAQLPPGAGVAAAPPCDPSTKLTPARTPAGFRAGAPMRTKLTEAGEKAQPLTLTGSVIGIRCGVIAGATVDVWHARANGVVDSSGMRLRGRQKTDADGRYRVETIVPGAVPGQAARLNMRVTVPGKATLSTMIFLPDALAKASNARDKAFDALLAMTLVERTSARVTASFNVILDL